MSKPKFKIGDKVRILDGSEIERYTGGFPSDMARLVGKIATVCGVKPWSDGRIASQLEGVKKKGGDFGYYSWDERGLELVGDAKEKIVICREGRSVFAKDLLTGKIAEAKCNPEDQFNFHIGAKLAFDRLMGLEEKPKEKQPEYLNTKVVCVALGHGFTGCIDVHWWTVGKVYSVVNGVIRDDEGDTRERVTSLKELNRLTDRYATFIELVE